MPSNVLQYNGALSSAALGAAEDTAALEPRAAKAAETALAAGAVAVMATQEAWQ